MNQESLESQILDETRLLYEEISIIEEEKNTFQELNKRFENYIDHIRRQSDSNSSNSHHPQDFDLTIATEYIQNIKTEYEKILEKKSTKLQHNIIENKNLQTKLQELQNSITILKEKNTHQKEEKQYFLEQIAKYEKKLLEYNLNIKELEEKSDKLEYKHTKLEIDYEELQSENMKNIQILNEETQKNAELNFLIETLKEKLDLTEKTYNEQIEIANKSLKELKENSNYVENSYINQSLLDVRSEILEEIETAKSNVISKYKNNYISIQAENEDLKKAVNETILTKENLESELKNIKDLYQSQKLKNSNLKFKLQSIESKHRNEIEIWKNRLEDSEEKLKKLNQKFNLIMEDYEIVISKHINLNTELEIYKKLLESEENRLGITEPALESSPKNIFYYKELYSETIKVSSIDETNAEYIKFYNPTEKALIFTSCKLKIKNKEVENLFRIPKLTVKAKSFVVFGNSNSVDSSSLDNNIKNIKLNVQNFAPKESFNTICILNGKGKVVLEFQIHKSSASPLKIPYHSTSRKRTLGMLVNLDSITPIQKRSIQKNEQNSDKNNFHDIENCKKDNCHIL